MLICVTDLSFCPFIHLGILSKDILKDVLYHTSTIFGKHLKFRISLLLTFVFSIAPSGSFYAAGFFMPLWRFIGWRRGCCHVMRPDLTKVSTTVWKDVMSLLVSLCVRGGWNWDKHLGNRIIKHCHLLNNGWPTRWHLLYYILLNMFQTLIRPSSGASEYLLCCVGW